MGSPRHRMLCGNTADKSDAGFICCPKIQRASAPRGAGVPRARGDDHGDPRSVIPARRPELLGRVLPVAQDQGRLFPSEQERREDLKNTGIGAFDIGEPLWGPRHEVRTLGEHDAPARVAVESELHAGVLGNVASGGAVGAPRGLLCFVEECFNNSSDWIAFAENKFEKDVLVIDKRRGIRDVSAPIPTRICELSSHSQGGPRNRGKRVTLSPRHRWRAPHQLRQEQHQERQRPGAPARS